LITRIKITNIKNMEIAGIWKEAAFRTRNPDKKENGQN
jgi:hypothetical protein